MIDNRLRTLWQWPAAILSFLFIAGPVHCQSRFERQERFDHDPGWEAINNRPNKDTARTVTQDFGYIASNSHGGSHGEIGGTIASAAEPAYYARKISSSSFARPLSASGALLCSGRKFHALLGFFNSATVNEWRTPNTIAIRLLGRGDRFFAFVEYGTQKWRAGGDSPGGFDTVSDPKTGKKQLKGFELSTVYRWRLQYDPDGNEGAGSITVSIGDQKSVCNLTRSHKQDGAIFDHFGLLNVMKSAVTGGEVWLSDIDINGEKQDLSHDPNWEGLNNRRTYTTSDVRPQGDFGFSATHYAGGLGAGELGGLVFRGDCRYKEKMASYGDRLSDLSLGLPLKASGKVCLRRGVSDSATLIGFYNSRDSMAINKSQESMLPRSFLGISIEGPSREGFLFYPVFRTHSSDTGSAQRSESPHILPDGSPHTWTLDYIPGLAGTKGRITVTLDGATVALDMDGTDPKTHFDRFGIVTTWIDGNGQRIYFDDLTYTCRQK